MSCSGLLRLAFSNGPSRGLKPAFRGGFSTIANSVVRKRTKQQLRGMDLGLTWAQRAKLCLIPTELVVLQYLLGNMLIALKFLKICGETDFAELTLLKAGM